MNSIGNDIVDLQIEEAALHPRYLKRVFTQSELGFIASDPEKLWLVWSAKEAAYKCLKRLRPEIIFSHKKFEYDYNQQTIKYENIKLDCKHLINDNYVYSYCRYADNLLLDDTNNWIENLSNNTDSPESASTLIRQIAKEKISNLLKINPDRLDIINSDSKIPELYIDQAKTNHLISFSHHGKFLAICFKTILN